MKPTLPNPDREMPKKEREWKIFEEFRKVCSDFAGCQAEVGNDPPDILCTDPDGKRIGIELAEWLHEGQMAKSKQISKQQESFLKAIQSEYLDPPANISFVWIYLKASVKKLNPSDMPGFRDELLERVRQVDRDWPRLRYQVFHRHEQTDFSGSPNLKRYIERLLFFPPQSMKTENGMKTIKYRRGMKWIDFEGPGGAYTPRDAENALISILRKKTHKYGNLPSDGKLAELRLIVYYEQAFVHNTPYSSEEEVARAARRRLESDHGPFHKVQLFFYQSRQVRRVYP